MLSAALAPGQQTLNASYSISGSALPTAGAIDFYWASGPSLADEIGNPYAVATQTSVGTFTASTALANLGAEPANASYILAVASSPDADAQHPFRVDCESARALLARTLGALGWPDRGRSGRKRLLFDHGGMLPSAGTIDFYWATGPAISETPRSARPSRCQPKRWPERIRRAPPSPHSGRSRRRQPISWPSGILRTCLRRMRLLPCG